MLESFSSVLFSESGFINHAAFWIIGIGYGCYKFKDEIFQTLGWGCFKMQAHLEIMMKKDKHRSSNSNSKFYFVQPNINNYIEGEIPSGLIRAIREKKDKDNELLIYSKLNHVSNKNDFYVYKLKNNKQILYPWDRYEISYKFISVEVNINNNTYVIKLSSKEDNFYINQNIVLSKPFIIWYLKHYYQFTGPFEKYSINIIDNNISLIELNSKEHSDGILLNEDGYEILQ